MHEYQDMAKYYDMFYSNKSYEHEINYLETFIKDKKTILDVGCGTGIHMHLLEEKGYTVAGLDLSKDMLSIAATRTKGELIEGNLIGTKLDQKYDAIISMFAVFNHLSNYNEFESAILNWYNHLNDQGLLIIDLHNGRQSGQKESIYQNCRRTMTWSFDPTTFKEHTKIKYYIDNETYYDTHEFLIYEIEKIKKILDKHNLHYKLYENYSLKEATDQSKNIEIIITK